MPLSWVAVLLLVALSHQALVQVYPPGGPDFEVSDNGLVSPTTTDLIKLTIDDLRSLSMDTLNTLSAEVQIPPNSYLEIGFSQREDDLMRQAAWRVRRGSGIAAESVLCTPLLDGTSEPACEVHGGPIAIKTFTPGYNRVTVTVEFVPEGVRTVMNWAGQYFSTLWYGFTGTDRFTLNLKSASLSPPLRLRNVEATLDGQTFTDEPIVLDDVLFFNEINYDDPARDTEEFIELLGQAGLDVTGYSVVLYRGNDGAMYNTLPLTGVLPDNGNNVGTYLINFPPDSVQNARGAVALVDPQDGVVEFLSYGGSFVALDGPAIGMTPTDIGVEENGGDGNGKSLQRIGPGRGRADFYWVGPTQWSPGALNTYQRVANPPSPQCANPTTLSTPVFFNEINYDPADGDQNEFIELVGEAGLSLQGYSIVLYRGINGLVYGTLPLSWYISNELNCVGVYVYRLPGDLHLRNGVDGLALVNPGGTVVEFLSYEGSVTAQEGPASGMTSTNIGVRQNSATQPSETLQRQGSGSGPSDFTWVGPILQSPGTINEDQTFLSTGGLPTTWTM